jgi:hypothetical protein
LILACEYKYLKPILGSDFYDAVVADPSSYSDLLDIAKPMLAWYVRYMLLPELKTEISDLGINRISIEGATNADEEAYAQTRNQALIIAESRREQLEEHLEDNYDDYDDYVPGDNPDNKVDIAGGIIFKKPSINYDPDDQWYKEKYGSDD